MESFAGMISLNSLGDKRTYYLNHEFTCPSFHINSNGQRLSYYLACGTNTVTFNIVTLIEQLERLFKKDDNQYIGIISNTGCNSPKTQFRNKGLIRYQINIFQMHHRRTLPYSFILITLYLFFPPLLSKYLLQLQPITKLNIWLKCIKYLQQIIKLIDDC